MRSICPEPPPTPFVEQMREGLRNWKVSQGAKDFAVVIHKERGRCIVAQRDFKAGEFIMEYEGDFVSREESYKSEKMYIQEGIGCYIVDAFWGGKPVSIDGSLKFGTLGRLINHARNGNLKPFRLLEVELGAAPRLGLFSSKEIKRGEELFWDYGIQRGETAWANFRVLSQHCHADSDGSSLDSDMDIFSNSSKPIPQKRQD